MELNVFLFPTEEAANEAITVVNTQLNIPKADGVTNTYAIPQQEPSSGKWYIPADEVTRKYLTDEQIITLPNITFEL